MIREYDHEVQGGSVVKPLLGVDNIGPQDAVVIRPRLDKNRGIVVSCGINPSYGKLNAYNMAVSVIDEALRNLVATGGDIRKTAMLDNFCFSSPERAEVLGDIVMSARGCYDAAVAFGVPFISGKDSLYNEWADSQGRIHQIPPTLLISAISVIDDVTKCVTMDLKGPGNDIYLVGETAGELGGSEYFRILGIQVGEVPNVNLSQAPKIMNKVHAALEQGLVRSCHDLSEGGLGLAISEMAFSGGFGVRLDLQDVIYVGKDRRFDFILFAESNTRFLLEVEKVHTDKIKNIFHGLPLAKIGETTEIKQLKIFFGKKKLIDLPLPIIQAKWQRKIV